MDSDALGDAQIRSEGRELGFKLKLTGPDDVGVVEVEQVVVSEEVSFLGVFSFGFDLNFRFDSVCIFVFITIVLLWFSFSFHPFCQFRSLFHLF